VAQGWTFPLAGGELTEIRRVYRHVLATGVTSEVPIPDELYPEGNWTILDSDLSGDTIALSFQEIPDDLDAILPPPRLFVVDATTGVSKEVPGAACLQGLGSMTGDGRHVSCWSSPSGLSRLTVVDLQTGAIGDILPAELSADLWSTRGAFLSRDGRTAIAHGGIGTGVQSYEQLYAVTFDV
jgi:hypothetical protein